MTHRKLTNHARTLRLFELVIDGGILDYSRAATLSHLLMQSHATPGEVCEFGCIKGHRAAFMASLTEKQMWVYDEFPGPALVAYERRQPPFIEGPLKPEAELVSELFANFDLEVPHIVEGDFCYLNFSHLPEQIAFAHVDTENSDTTKTVLDLIWPFVSFGGIVVLNQFNHTETDNVRKGYEAWQPEGEKPVLQQPIATHGQASVHAYFVKT